VSAANLVTTSATLDHAQGTIRVVDGAYSDAASWIGATNPDGVDVSVAAFDFVNQLWISEATRELSAVSFPEAATMSALMEGPCVT
jgi:hypothetical protein